MYYEYLYRHLLGEIDEHDLNLLLKAEYLPFEEIFPNKAHDERVRKVLDDIHRMKYHRAEACYD